MSQQTESTTNGSDSEEGLFPVSGKWFSVVFYGALLIWILLLMFWGWGWSWDNKLFPFGAGAIAVLLLVTQVANSLFPSLFKRITAAVDGEAESGEGDEFRQRMDEAAESDTGRSKAVREQYELVMLGWVIALPILLYFVGFGWVLPLYTFAFVLYFLRDAKMAVAMAVLITLFIWLLFVVFLDVQLWEGTLGLVDPLSYLPQPI